MEKERKNVENAKKNGLLKAFCDAWTFECMLLFLAFILPFLNLLPKPTAWLLGLSAGMLFCFVIFMDFKETNWRTSIKNLPPEAWLIFLLVVLFCLSVSTKQPLSSLKSGWTYALLLCSFFPAFCACQNASFRQKFQMVIVFSSTIVSAYGVYQYFFMDLELKWVDFSLFSNIGARVTSVFSNPNILGAYLLLCLPFSLSYLMNCKGILQKSATEIAAMLQLLCLTLTWSRGAWLGVITEVAAFFLLYSRKSRRWFFFSMMLSPLTVPFLPQTVIQRLTSIHTEGDSSIRYRMQTWKGVWRMIKAHPFGVGCGERAFSAAYREYAVMGTETVPHAHHLLMQIACELGWIGICIFLLLCFLLVYRGIKSYPLCTDKERTAQLLSGCALIGSFVMGLFDHIWYHRGVFWLFWTVVAFAFSTVYPTLLSIDLKTEK